MVKKMEDTRMEMVVKMVLQGLTREANLVHGSDILKDVEAQQKFMQVLTTQKPNENSFNFVIQFANPDWFSYTKSMNNRQVSEFISLAQKNDIDLYQKNKDDIILLDLLINQVRVVEYEPIIYQLNGQKFSQAFKEGKIFDTLAHMLGQDISRISYYKEPSALVDSILNKLSNPEVIGSEAHHKLLATNNPFTKALFEHEALPNIQRLSTRHPDFFANHKDMLTSTAMIKNMMSNYSWTSEHRDTAHEMLEQDRFKPQASILPSDYADAWNKGAVKLVIDSPHYATYKEILKKGLLDSGQLNHPQQTVFESFIKQNLKNTQQVSNPMEYALRVMAELNDLTSLGVLATANVHDRKTMTSWLEATLHKKDRGENRLSDDLMQFSHEFRFHPVMLERLVDILDKRYNYQPPVDPAVQQKKDIILNLWNEWMDKTVFVMENGKDNEHGDDKKLSSTQVKP